MSTDTSLRGRRLLTPLTLHRWLICVVSSFVVVDTSELRKLYLRRHLEAAAPDEPAPAAVAATTSGA